MISRRHFLTTSALLTAGICLNACSAAPSAIDEGEPQILATGLDFAEGPAFDPSGGLWCTEVQGGNIVHIEGKILTRFAVGGAPGGRANGMIFMPDGSAVVADSGRNIIYSYLPKDNTWKPLLDSVAGHPLQSPNDLTRDTAGNILFTCPNFSNTDPTGYVVCFTPDGTATVVAEGLHRPNGLDIVINADRQEFLVVADTYAKTLFRGTWDAARQVWQDSTAWAQVGGSEGPDGMAVAADGLIYQAIYGDGVIRIVGTDGKVKREIKVPGTNPTNVAIDPSGKLGIVVSEAQNGQLIAYPNLKVKPQIIR